MTKNKIIVSLSIASFVFVGFSGNIAMAQTVTGSGTLNYLPLWTSTSSIGNSVMYQSSSNIGIGTTAPITQLHVPGKAPSSPVGSVAITGPRKIYIQGRYAYILANTDLKIFDISNTASPSFVGSIGSNTNALYVQGRYAYTGGGGYLYFQIFDISNPASPSLVSSIEAADRPTSIYVQGRYAYVAIDDNGSGHGKLQIFDVSNPSSPSLRGSVDICCGAISIYVQGKYAYVLDNTLGGLKIIDVSNPNSPLIVGSVGTDLYPTSVYVQGRYAYVTIGTNSKLQIFDVSNSVSPSLVSTVGTGASPQSVYVQGRYAYVANALNSSQIFDVSNPASPSVVGTLGSTGGTSLYAQGRYVYELDYTTLKIFDVGGSYIQQLEAGGIEAGTLATRSNLQVGNDLDVKGGIGIGTGGLFSAGNIATKGDAFVGGQIKIASGTPGIGKVLTSDANGLATWQTPSGGSGTNYWSLTGNNLYPTSTAYNVGIGTTTPASSVKLALDSGNSGTANYMSFGQGGEKTWIGSETNASRSFIVYDKASSTYRMAIDKAGNVGIGMTAPQGKLSVVGDGTGYGIMGGSTGCGGNYTGLSLNGTAFSSCTNYNLLGSATNSTFYINRPTGGAIRFRENNTDQMIIETGGNVGIGTASPSQKLEVNGGMRLNTATAKPTCDSSVRGTFWATQGAAGVKDNVEVCVKDAANAYAWRTLY